MSLDLGSLEILGAATVGQPGQRRFCLYVQGRRGSAIIWMEKEQLNRLSLTLDQVLAQLTEGQVLRTEAQVGGLPAPAGLPEDFLSAPEYDLRSSQLALTYDERDEMFTLIVTPVEILLELGQEEPQALIREDDAVSFHFTQKQAQELASTITVLMTGGRPVCPLCQAPLDGGPHACVKQNGHHEIVQLVEDEDDE
ncbi:MAG TPA: hypothetical protein DCL75_07320 [Ktedonobacter sp.]|jgi:uncharacterized repeat protein (TIGR03847 family)|nr:hypothetical protein [Ktedonobacter sp.]HAG98655.1 hypothetical protein [Ktedonobacter sp.]